MFTIVINMHVAFNNLIECSGVHTFKDRAELFAESEYVTEPEAVTEPRGILTQAKELSLEGDLASEIIAEQTDSTIDNAPKTFAAVNPTGGHETLATSTDNTGGAKNAGRTRKTCKARTTKKTRNARMNPEPITYTNGTTPYRVENPMPEGALGLAASRWAKKDYSVSSPAA